MSYISTSFVGVKEIQLGEVITRPNGVNGRLFTTQDILIAMEDGSTAQVTFHLQTGARSLVLGDAISNEFVVDAS